jgi:putative ABC transport system permease protein
MAGTNLSSNPRLAAMPEAAPPQATEAEAAGSPADNSTEGTAFLIQYATPLAAAIMPRMVNSQSALQAASPA